MSDVKKVVSRVTRSKKVAKTSYNKISRFYDLIANRFESKYRNIALRKLKAQRGEKILEIGFGTGECLLALVKSVGTVGRVYGIDISEGMINITYSKIRKVGLHERVDLKCRDAVNLPYENNFFDAVFMSFTLELFDTPEIPTLLKECYRVLRNGGRLCVVSMSKKGKTSVMTEFYEWLHKKCPKYFDCRPIYVQDALQDTSFRILDITEMSMFGLPVEIILGRKILF